LSPSIPTLPKMLAAAGYETAIIGKWHLMGDYGKRPGDPALHGFKNVICSESAYIGPGYYFHPYKHLPGLAARNPGEYLTDRMNQEAVDFISANASRPFFLYLAHYAPHTNLAGKREMVERYRNKPGAGKDRNNPVLAAMLESIDEGIGMISAKLDELKLTRDTIFVFNSDNGGEHLVTSNAPLRGGKSQVYEGGIRVPLIVRGPNFTGGRTSDRVVSSIDYYPTLLDAAGSKAPQGHVVDGESLLRQGKPSRELFWHYPLEKPHFLGGRSGGAIRSGNRKLIEFYDSGQCELYDLAADPSETKNLASASPDEVSRLRNRFAEWKKDAVH
jgi:arylsulfatase A-like enzyme